MVINQEIMFMFSILYNICRDEFRQLKFKTWIEFNVSEHLYRLSINKPFESINE